MIPLALFLLPYVPGWARPWLLGLALGRKPVRIGFVKYIIAWNNVTTLPRNAIRAPAREPVSNR